MNTQTQPNMQMDFPADAPLLNAAQWGGIETSVLDNGPGRGTRIAWVNTGAGLRYKVVPDRGMDIADAEFMGQSLTWHSHAGVTAPSQARHRGFEWLRGFAGGLVVGCGPVNVGDPFEENGEEYGLHGTHSNTRATLESVVNPDLPRGRRDMSITGIVRSARVFGPNIELRRTLRSTLGVPSIEIHDEFTNLGNTATPFAWMLHINFGYPLLEPECSTFCYAGKVEPAFDSDDWFARADARVAPRPLEHHRGGGEEFAYIDPDVDEEGMVTAGIVNSRRSVGLAMMFRKAHYPRLGHWLHFGPGGSYIASLEPLTAGVEGWARDRERGWFSMLEACQQRVLQCRLAVITEPAQLQALASMGHPPG